MPVLHQLQPSFNNGEISPLLYDRVDYNKFTSSVKSGKNMFVHPQGGMSNRAGTKMLGMAKVETYYAWGEETSSRVYYTLSEKPKADEEYYSKQSDGSFISAGYISEVSSDFSSFTNEVGRTCVRSSSLDELIDNKKKVRLIPFEFSNTETYMIGFGDFYCRFYTTNGQVVTEEGLPYEIPSPFKTEDLDKIRYCQSGDVMYIAWGGKPQTLTRYGHTDWKFADYDYKNGPLTFEDNIRCSISSSYENGVFTSYLNKIGGSFSESDLKRIFRVKVIIKNQTLSGKLNNISLVDEWKSVIFYVPKSYEIQTKGTWNGSFAIEVSSDGDNWETGNVFNSFNGSANYNFTGNLEGSEKKFVRINFQDITTYSDTGLEFSFRTTKEEEYLYVKSLEKVSDTSLKVEITSHNAYVLNFIQSSFGLVDIETPVLTSNDSASSVLTITGNHPDITNAYLTLDGKGTIGSNGAYTGMYGVVEGGPYNVDYNFTTPLWFDKVSIFLGYATWKVGLSLLQGGQWVWGGWFIDNHSASGWFSLPVLNVGTSAVRLTFYNDYNSSWYGRFFEIDFGQLRKREANIVDYETSIGLWGGEHKYPTEVDLYQDRIVWATNNQIDATKISDYTNFGVSTEVTDDDAISVIIKDKKINKINSAIAGSQLVVFTDSGNFIHNNDTFTPSSATFLNQGSTGGADVKPVIVRDNIIYVHPMKQAISDYAYSFETDGYAGQDITLLANHLFDNKKIKELAYQQEPYSIIWVLQEEGNVLACTYLRQQNVIAWTPMDFGGKVLSIGVMSNGSNQELYLAVDRKNGVFIEKMPYRMLDNDPKERFFVDCGSTYRGEPANIIAGLEYLEGESVVALADGYVVKDLVVENGQITLPTPASIVTVGLSYESVLETLTFDVSQGDGSNLNRKKRVVAVSVRYNNSRGSRISVNGHREVPMLERKIDNTDTDISLKSGFYREILPSAHNEPTTIKIRQDEPLPLTIVSIIPELEYER